MFLCDAWLFQLICLDASYKLNASKSPFLGARFLAIILGGIIPKVGLYMNLSGFLFREFSVKSKYLLSFPGATAVLVMSAGCFQWR